MCAHALSGATAAQAWAALAALELAYERLVLVLGLPSPLADDFGGSPALDLYVSPASRDDPSAEPSVPPGNPSGAREPLRVAYDPPRLGGFDRAPAFCEVAVSDPVLLERSATLCVGEAIALGLDAGETPHLRRAFATALWWFTGVPTALDVQAIADAQAHPERAVARRDLDASSEGAALLFEYLESTRAVGELGTLSTALLSASAQETPSDAFRFENEPDAVDVLRHTSGGRAKLVGLFRDFAVARTFVGARDDGQHLPATTFAGRFGVTPFDWVIRASTLPRRVLLSRPVEPSGAALVWLDLEGFPEGGSLGFQAEWELPVAFAWTFVRIADDGSEISRVDVPFQERASEVEARLTELQGARAVAIVGTYLDEVSLAHPFDPDVEPFEPHAATIYLVKL